MKTKRRGGFFKKQIHLGETEKLMSNLSTSLNDVVLHTLSEDDVHDLCLIWHLDYDKGRSRKALVRIFNSQPATVYNNLLYYSFVYLMPLYLTYRAKGWFPDFKLDDFKSNKSIYEYMQSVPKLMLAWEAVLYYISMTTISSHAASFGLRIKNFFTSKTPVVYDEHANKKTAVIIVNALKRNM
jgi:hypothetical protein